MSRARGRKAHFSETKFKPPNASFIFICFQLAVHDLYSVFCFPLTPGAFYPKCFFGHLGDFFLAQACIEIKILKQESDLRLSRLCFLYYFNFSFRFSFFPFSFLFASVIGLLMGLLAAKKLQRGHHRDEQISPWSSHV